MGDKFYLYLAAAAGALLLISLALALRRAWRRSKPRSGSSATRFGKDIHLRDLFRLAVQLEEEGHAFYLKMAEKVSDQAAKELCLWLAGEEARHRDIFQAQLDGWRPLGIHARDWPLFIENVKKEGFFSAAPGAGASEKELAAYAIRQEIKSAEFYLLFEDSFPEAWKRVKMRGLVAAERGHEARLRAAYPGGV